MAPPIDTGMGWTLVFLACISYSGAVALLVAGETVLTTVLGTILLSVGGSCAFTAYDTCFRVANRAGSVGSKPVPLTAAKLKASLSKASFQRDHVEYQIDLQRGDKTWAVHHRYSEFAALVDESVVAAKLSNRLPEKLWRQSLNDPKMVERKQGLEAFVNDLANLLNKKGCEPDLPLVKFFAL